MGPKNDALKLRLANVDRRERLVDSVVAGNAGIETERSATQTEGRWAKQGACSKIAVMCVFDAFAYVCACVCTVCGGLESFRGSLRRDNSAPL